MKELISIIIPTYNAQDTIIECIDSVISQTYPRKEIIVVDDGSTDNTAELITEKYETVSCLKYIRIDHNGFEGAVRNRGVEISGGEYISFLDADDYWDADVLSHLMNTLKNNPEAQVCYGALRYIGGQFDGKYVHDFRTPYSGYVFDKLLERNFMPIHPALLLKSSFEVVGGFDETIRIGPDYDFWLRITHSFCVVYAGKAVGYYRIRDESVFHSVKPLERNIQVLSIVRKIKKLFHLRNPQVYKRLAVIYLTIVKNLCSEKKYIRIFGYIFRFFINSLFYYYHRLLRKKA